MLVSLDDNVPFRLATSSVVSFRSARNSQSLGLGFFIFSVARRRGSVRFDGEGEEVLRDRDRYSWIKGQRSGTTTFFRVNVSSLSGKLEGN